MTLASGYVWIISFTKRVSVVPEVRVDVEPAPSLRNSSFVGEACRRQLYGIWYLPVGWKFAGADERRESGSDDEKDG
jgi:hypothetical protein